jgi:hypothetical protein
LRLVLKSNSGANANIEQAPIAIGGISNTEVECKMQILNIEQGILNIEY